MPDTPSIPVVQQGVLLDLFTDPGQRATPENQHLHFMALASISGIGPASLRSLYDSFPALGNIWYTEEEKLREQLRAAHVRSAEKLAKSILSQREGAVTTAANEIEALSNRGIRLLLDSDPEFPLHLKAIPSAPRWLFVQGNSALLRRESSVAVVGTREASPIGINLTKQVCELLVRWGYVVVSGLADGIDTVAHRTVVDLRGDTVAVLGTGFNIEFPAGSMLLRERILERGGAILTEYFPNAMYSKQSFVQRNRIQAGLSNVVLPVESQRRSGTAHTVRFAEEFGRVLFGVWNTRYPAHERSEMLLQLIAKGYPCFDLATDDGRRGLQLALRRFDRDAVPREVDDRIIWRSAYGPALRALKAAIEARPPERAEATDWIFQVFSRILYNEAEPTDGTQGGLFRS